MRFMKIHLKAKYYMYRSAIYEIFGSCQETFLYFGFNLSEFVDLWKKTLHSWLVVAKLKLIACN